MKKEAEDEAARIVAEAEKAVADAAAAAAALLEPAAGAETGEAASDGATPEEEGGAAVEAAAPSEEETAAEEVAAEVEAAAEEVAAEEAEADEPPSPEEEEEDHEGGDDGSHDDKDEDDDDDDDKHPGDDMDDKVKEEDKDPLPTDPGVARTPCARRAESLPAHPAHAYAVPFRGWGREEAGPRGEGGGASRLCHINGKVRYVTQVRAQSRGWHSHTGGSSSGSMACSMPSRVAPSPPVTMSTQATPCRRLPRRVSCRVSPAHRRRARSPGRRGWR